MAAGCYFGLGDQVTDNIVMAMSSGWQRVVVEIMLLLHLITAYPIITNPPAQFFEQLFNIPSGLDQELYVLFSLLFFRFQLEKMCLQNILRAGSVIYCRVHTKLRSHPQPGRGLHSDSSHLRLPTLFLHETGGCQQGEEGLGPEVKLSIWSYCDYKV